MHSTNYYDTFIEIAEDCNLDAASIPPSKERPTIAQLQYEMLIKNPYGFTSDDVLYKVVGERKNVSRDEFFSKGQPCFRASPLTKQYGWGVHCDSAGKIAIYPVESDEYRALANDPSLAHKKAMRSKRS